MALALGLSSRGNAFPRFIAGKGIAAHVGAEMLKKIENPIKFQWGSGGADQPPAVINGYDVTLLIDVCKVILAADSESPFSNKQSGTYIDS